MEDKISQRRGFIINVAYISICIALVYLCVKYLVPWMLPFIIGYVIALTVKPLVLWVAKKTPLNGKAAACIVLLLAYALIGGLVFWGGAKLFGLIRVGFSNLPGYYEDVLKPLILNINDFLAGGFGRMDPQMAAETTTALGDLLQSIQSWLFSLSSVALGALGSLTAKVPSFLLTFLFSIMSSLIISMNYREVTNFLVKQIPAKYRELLFEIRDSVLVTMGRYLRAYLTLMCVTFVELSIGLTVLRVENSIGIALLIAIFDALPVLGTGGIMIPWAVISLLQGQYFLALGLAIVYALVALIRSVIEPRIVGAHLGLHPLVTICAIYLGFRLMGVVGMILAPITVQILVGLHRSGFIKLWKS